MVISLRGLPPHDLGLAETGSARAANGMVEVMLQSLDDWHSPPGNLVRVQMSPSLARSLARSLDTAAEDAEVKDASAAAANSASRATALSRMTFAEASPRLWEPAKEAEERAAIGVPRSMSASSRVPKSSNETANGAT